MEVIIMASLKVKISSTLFGLKMHLISIDQVHRPITYGKQTIISRGGVCQITLMLLLLLTLPLEST